MLINKKLAEQIKQMFDIDQDIRFQGVANKKLVEPIRNLVGEKEIKKKTNLNWGLANFLVYSIDVVNNYRIRGIINSYGYPTSKLIGKAGMHYFFLLIQHQDFDLELQKECLEKCDFSPTDEAYLTDRVLVNSGRKQKFGTQYTTDKKTGKIVMQPVADKNNLQKRRKEVGLGPSEDDLIILRKRNKK